MPGLVPKNACLLEKRVFLHLFFQDVSNGEIADQGLQLGFQLKFPDQGIFTLWNGHNMVAYLNYSIPNFF